MDIELETLIAASNAFLKEPLPDTWEDMSEEYQDEWLSEYVWQPIDHLKPSEIFSLIEDHAENSVGPLIQSSLEKVSSKLVSLSLKDDLRLLDLSSLDLMGLLQDTK